MADTIINTPGVTRTADDGTAAIGWVVALLVTLAVIVAGFVLYRNGSLPGLPNTGTNINVTVPSESDTRGSNGASGSTDGGGTINY